MTALRTLKAVLDHEVTLAQGRQTAASGVVPEVTPEPEAVPYQYRRRATDRKGVPGTGLVIGVVLGILAWAALGMLAHNLFSPRQEPAPRAAPVPASEQVMGELPTPERGKLPELPTPKEGESIFFRWTANPPSLGRSRTSTEKDVNMSTPTPYWQKEGELRAPWIQRWPTARLLSDLTREQLVEIKAFLLESETLPPLESVEALLRHVRYNSDPRLLRKVWGTDHVMLADVGRLREGYAKAGIGRKRRGRPAGDAKRAEVEGRASCEMLCSIHGTTTHNTKTRKCYKCRDAEEEMWEVSPISQAWELRKGRLIRDHKLGKLDKAEFKARVKRGYTQARYRFRKQLSPKSERGAGN